jgi:hypothetical protein
LVTLLPGASKIILSGLSNPSRWAIAAYIIGMAATALTVIAELLLILLNGDQFQHSSAPL